MSKKKEKDLSAEREKKFAPIARQLVKIILDADLPIGNYLKEEYTKFNDIAKDIIQLMMDNEITYIDKEFLFQLALRNEAETIVNKYVGKIEFKNKEGKIQEIILNKETVSSIVLLPFTLVRGIVISSLEKSFNRIIDRVLGKSVLDLTLNEMDVMLKNSESATIGRA